MFLLNGQLKRFHEDHLLTAYLQVTLTLTRQLFLLYLLMLITDMHGLAIYRLQHISAK